MFERKSKKSHKLRIELPPNCYTFDYLKQSGIKADFPLLDTHFLNGVGHLTHTVGFIFLLLFGCYVLNHIEVISLSVKASLLVIIGMFLSLLTFGLLYCRHLYLLMMRRYIRKVSKPILLEPIAVVLLPSKRDILDKVGFKYSKTAIMYKETGTKKPKFYMEAIRTGMVNSFPTQTALLYKHPTNPHFYSVDNEFMLSKNHDLVFEGKLVSSCSL